MALHRAQGGKLCCSGKRDKGKSPRPSGKPFRAGRGWLRQWCTRVPHHRGSGVQRGAHLRRISYTLRKRDRSRSSAESHAPTFLEVHMSWDQWSNSLMQAKLTPEGGWKRGPFSFHDQLLLLFSRSVMSDSLWPHGLQHTRLLYPSPTPGVCSNICSLSQWCHPTTSFSVAPFSSCPQSFPASGSFLVSWLFASGGQRIGVSASGSVLPMHILGLISFRIAWFDLLAVQGTLKSLLQHHSSKASIQCSAFFMIQLSHPFMTTGKTIVLTIRTFFSKVMSLLFNMLYRLVIPLSKLGPLEKRMANNFSILALRTPRTVWSVFLSLKTLLLSTSRHLVIGK